MRNVKTVSDLIKELSYMPPDAVVVYQDYDTADYHPVGGFDADSIKKFRYVEDVRQENPLIDYSHYEHDENGGTVCVEIYL